MPLTRMRFTAWLDDPENPDAEPVGHEVEVRTVDQLKGELEGAKRGVVMKAHLMHTTTLWIWASMVRTGAYKGKFDDFTVRLIQFDDVDDEEPQLVDPTPAESADSA